MLVTWVKRMKFVDIIAASLMVRDQGLYLQDVFAWDVPQKNLHISIFLFDVNFLKCDRLTF